MPRKALPAAVQVSIGCSVVFQAVPLALGVRTTFCSSPMERARSRFSETMAAAS